MLNLLLAFVLSINTTTDECVWYFLNLFIDTTIGVFICFALMLLIEKIAVKKNIKGLKSGLYYERVIKKGKNVIKLKPNLYFSQLGVWLFVVVMVYRYINH
jgi:hypothetical protein